MRFRDKVAMRLIGKSSGLSKADFGDDAWWSGMIRQKKTSGTIAWNNWTAQRQEYRGTTYACIRKIAPAVAAASFHLFIPAGNDKRNSSKRIELDDKRKEFLSGIPFCKQIMKLNEDVEEITNHPALDVFKRANGSMTRYQLFDNLMINMGLNGNEYWHPVLNENESFPVMIQRMPPERMDPVKKDGILTGYKLKRGFGKKDKLFTLEEIIHFWYPNPFDMFQGYSPVAAASQRISAEVNTATFQNSTLENMGIPPAIVKIMRQMDSEKFSEFKKAFGDIFESAVNANRVGFTQGEWEIEVLGQTMQEMGYIEGAKMIREFIANDFQVPLSKLTMESSNRAVAEAGNTEFQRDTILPNLTMIAEELTESMIPLFPSLVDTGAFYMFDNPVPEDMRLKMMQTRILRTTGVSTPNEERPEYGFEPHPSEEAESLAPVRAPIEPSEPSEVERMAKAAIDAAIDGKIDGMRNGGCDHE